MGGGCVVRRPDALHLKLHPSESERHTRNAGFFMPSGVPAIYLLSNGFISCHAPSKSSSSAEAKNGVFTQMPTS